MRLGTNALASFGNAMGILIVLMGPMRLPVTHLRKSSTLVLHQSLNVSNQGFAFQKSGPVMDRKTALMGVMKLDA